MAECYVMKMAWHMGMGDVKGLIWTVQYGDKGTTFITLTLSNTMHKTNTVGLDVMK